MNRDKGIYTVEFAIVAAVFFILLFGAIEVGRLLYTYSVLQEASRRAARLAIVCQPSTNIDDLALFNGANLVPNLTADNLDIRYLNGKGDDVTGADIELVKAEIKNYQHDLWIPGLHLSLNSPVFTTTLPRESLGVFPGGSTICQ
ncbi:MULTISPECIES: TadE/TadG family type IV pilus assembly protein [Shewanella]|uniref:TadE/TadG family type IV pilus assembly protein n=1 Tax=Shewanella TaxID=22 RepID=UPI002014B841|nr:MULTISPECIES: TadE family protein [Shewanella]MCL2908402.1 pilus assembly protein [Shewanella aquimarina]